MQPEVDETREAPMGVVMRTLVGFAGSGCTMREVDPDFRTGC